MVACGIYPFGMYPRGLYPYGIYPLEIVAIEPEPTHEPSELENLIELYSTYKVGDAATDNISLAQLALLESATASKVTRLNPGFAGTELNLFKMYIILDAWSTRSGSGQIIEKTVKDTRWKVSEAKSSSQWMDKALQMRAEYLQINSVNIAPKGVSRCDYDMKGFDNTTIRQWGDPSASI